jgi:4-hydroxyphenylacetate 3-monooxygenase
MAARSGRQFLERLSAARVHVEIQGETVTGHINEHPAFRNVIRSYADLYDMQHDPAYHDVLTYPSPATGEPVATSFLIPRTPEDLDKRHRAFTCARPIGAGERSATRAGFLHNAAST